MRDEFAERVGRAIVSLPQDLKAALRVVEDADVEDADRVALAGAVLHILSGANVIPGMRGVLAQAGAVLVFREVLGRVVAANESVRGDHEPEAPELFGELDAFLAAARKYLDDAYPVVEKAASGVAKIVHQGHTAPSCVTDTEGSRWLYDAVHEAIVDRLEVDDEDVTRELKSVEQILPPLKSKIGKS